jgi:two-component system sensor histidine kinase ChvG
VSLRSKIILTCMAVAIIPLYAMTHYVTGFFDHFTRTALENELINYAFVVGEEYKTRLVRGDEPAAFNEVLQKYAGQFQASISVLSTNGLVLFTTDEDRSPGNDLSARPEVQKAMAGRYGARTALSEQRKYVYYFIALPIVRAGHAVGIAYLSRHTSPIIRAVSVLKQNFRWAIAVSLSLAVLLSILLAQTITRRLRNLQIAADEFAKGNKALGLQPSGHDEITELEKAFVSMAGEIERQNSYNRDFLAATAHELKTPLTAIKGAAEVLEQGAAEKPEARTKFLNNIQFETDRLIRMVGQLAELTRLDTEMLRGKKEKHDLGACLREIVGRLENTFPANHAPLTLEIPAQPFPVLILPGRIEQVIANLLENAFRYTPASGAVTLSVKTGENGTVIACVADTGCGIAPANRPRVFDRFFTTEPKNQMRSYGSGLGLSIAQSIVRNHGGEIWVESEPGQGARFFFSLPLV